MATTPATPLEQLLDPVAECFTPEVARRLVELRVSDETQSRISELAEKANEGQLTPAERDEYAEFVEAMDLVAILQAKARDVLARRPS